MTATPLIDYTDNVDIPLSTLSVGFSICRGKHAMENAQAIVATEAPTAIGPYSHAIFAGRFLFVPGQLPINLADGKMIEGNITKRTKRVFQIVEATIDSAACSIADVLKITRFLTDMLDFQHVNKVYSQHFKSPYPARSAVQVSALPLGFNIEAEAVVHIL